MRKKLLPLFFALTAFFAGGRAAALELDLSGGLGNTFFDTRRTSPIGNGDFSGSLELTGRFKLSFDPSDQISFNAFMERDGVLRNRLGAAAGWTAGFFSIFGGPFFGLFNEGASPVQTGVLGGIGLDFPGILFVRAGGGATLGPPLLNDRSKIETWEFAAGFWLPNIVNTFSVGMKSYEDGRQDEIIRWQYRADIFDKSYPYRVQVNIGYQKLLRAYYIASSRQEDIFNVIFLGSEFSFRLAPVISLRLGGEIPVYAWGKSPLGKQDGLILFQAAAGVTLFFD